MGMAITISECDLKSISDVFLELTGQKYFLNETQSVTSTCIFVPLWCVASLILK